MLTDRTVDYLGITYTVTARQLSGSWTWRLEATRKGAGAHSNYVWDADVSGYSPEHADLRRAEAGRLSLHLVAEAFPVEYARGTKPQAEDGHLKGWVEVEEMPDVVARALARYDVSGDVTMTIAAERLEYRRIEHGGYEQGASRYEARTMARCLVHALEVGNVPAQEKWARWIVDPEAAVQAELRAMETP